MNYKMLFDYFKEGVIIFMFEIWLYCEIIMFYLAKHNTKKILLSEHFIALSSSLCTQRTELRRTYNTEQ